MFQYFLFIDFHGKNLFERPILADFPIFFVYLFAKGIELHKEGKQLNGSERFVIDNIATEKDCKILSSLVQVFRISFILLFFLLFCLLQFCLLYFALLYFTLPYLTLLYFTLLYFTSLYFTLLHFTFTLL